MIYLDTHVVIWLYEGTVEKLSATARNSIESNDVRISAAVVLELQYLHEIGRLKPIAAEVVNALATDIDLRVCDRPFYKIVNEALAENWGRDPFDRLIVANAKEQRAMLVTKDERIRQNYLLSVW